ncbi:uncharacterized protein LOC124195944 [Daphnia pulex]|uniref:uncharacterized protein LOC124195944 n=1 Tax=Daphnia pulex TaxID=6669 RepID=UPI001EDFD0D0|nr:uncharacterized protein LOC124195944 [Daphnia pulex]
MPQQRNVRTTNNSEIAIKPASHTTERHSTYCQMSHPDRNTSTYHTPPSHRATVAQSAKIYREPSEFETWRTKIDKKTEDDNAAEESTVDVHPSSTSTPRHQHGVTFLACSSGLEDPEIGCRSDDIGGAKPKRSLKFLSNGNHPHASQVPSFFTMAKPSKEVVASLAAIFNDKAASNRTPSVPQRKSTYTPEKLKRD